MLPPLINNNDRAPTNGSFVAATIYSVRIQIKLVEIVVIASINYAKCALHLIICVAFIYRLRRSRRPPKIKRVIPLKWSASAPIIALLYIVSVNKLFASALLAIRTNRRRTYIISYRELPFPPLLLIRVCIETIQYEMTVAICLLHYYYHQWIKRR